MSALPVATTTFKSAGGRGGGSKIRVKCTGLLEIIFIIGGLTKSLLTCYGKDFCECQLYHGKDAVLWGSLKSGKADIHKDIIK
jgi:hypothetical protein